jgi:[ribosomal protein S5]-alanine N-acetyltransferase
MTRLVLKNATLELLDAAIADAAQLARLLDAEVAEGWAGFPEALPRLRDILAADPAASEWGTVLFLLESPRTLVGMGGYKGPPSDQGRVEIGYAIAPSQQRRGLATAAARALVTRAFADARVHAVTAQTLGQPNASTRVLERLGFRRSDETVHPEVAPLWTFSVERAEFGTSDA